MERTIVKINKEAVTANARGSRWEELLAAFIATQDVRESSRRLYARTLKLYFEWIEEEGKRLSELSRTDLLEYKDSLFAKGLSSLSVSNYITPLRKFYEWAEAEKLYPNIAKGLKTPPRKQAFKKQHLTDEEGKALLAHFQEEGLRNYAIVNLMLRTGLRTIEVVRANVGDITFKGGRRIMRVWGKGRSERDEFVILTEKAYEPIAQYLATRKGAKAGEPLFSADSHRNTGERLTTRTISGICKRGLQAIGLDGREYTAHSLRHTTAVSILLQGGNISEAQAVLRHASPTTTQIYTESIKEDMRLRNSTEALLDNMF